MRVEQTLHGYFDGHRLLASSVELPRDARHAMLGLSDLSGRAMVRGFDEYLTGYRLPGTDYYAVARTWYAPEMDRPGCVWTHTLLIARADLDSTRNIGGLLTLFRRPTDRHSWDNYECAADALLVGHRGALADRTPDSAVGLLLGALYEFPDAPILVPSIEANAYEELFLEIWSQQWPSLRASFAFCTGAISPRLLKGKPFDLQVVPSSALREAKRGLPSHVLVELEKDDRALAPAKWVSVAVADLRGRDLNGFYDFLNRYTRRMPGVRHAFAPLAELFPLLASCGIERTIDLEELAELIGQYYGAPSEGQRLKHALFGRNALLLTALYPGVSECNLLRLLSTSRHAAAFDADDLQLEGRARRLWTENRHDALWLIDQLVRNDHNELGERLLFNLVCDIGIDEAEELAPIVPALTGTLIRLNPSVASSRELWHGPPERQWSLFEAATSGKYDSTELQSSIVVAMLQAGSDAIADGVTRKIGSTAAFAVLSWFDESTWTSPSQLPAGWRRALASYPGAMLDWLESSEQPREASAALVADLLEPHVGAVRQYGPSPWLKNYRNEDCAIDEDARLRLHAFSLALGFENLGPGSDELVARSFSVVHNAFACDRLSYSLWSWFENQVPPLSWLRNWDRCERLRRGLVNKFYKYRWPVSQFLRCADSDELLRRLLESSYKVKAGDFLLGELKKAMLKNELDASEGYLSVIKTF